MDTMLYKAGQRLVTGFDGLTLPRETIDAIRRFKIANIILFQRNIGTPAQVRALCANIQDVIASETGHPAFITIDQEGGMVSRLSDSSAAVTPGAQALAATGKPENAYQVGRIIGEELSALGINFNLAPDMDINSNPDNPVIGVRSFGDTPEIVSTYGAQMLRGLREGGVLCCAKHFPGHGDTDVDSHLSLPAIHKSAEALKAWELRSFEAAIAAGVPAIMTSHILFPALEDAHYPATMSRRIISDILRGEMGFSGLVLSDCMMMGAIAKMFGTAPGVLAAIKAGVDLVFVSHDAALAGKAIEIILEACDTGEIDAAEFGASHERILAAKAKLPKALPPLDTVGSPAHREIVERIMREAITAVPGPDTKLPALGSDPLFCACYPYCATGAFNPSADDFHFALHMARHIGGTGIVSAINPDADEIESILRQVPGHSAIVLGTYDALTNPGQLRLREALAQTGLPMVSVALFNPYDLRDLPPGVVGLASYEYDPLALSALADVLQGNCKPQGKLPVKIS